MSLSNSTSRAVSHAVSYASRSVTRRFVSQSYRPLALTTQYLPSSKAPVYVAHRSFSACMKHRAGIMPHAEDPAPPDNEPHTTSNAQATEITDSEYHELSDEFMEDLNNRAEQLQESREDVEVEYAAGVLSITFPPNGTYIINKQPPNKQIWLSSPVSGPKRYDWVLAGESMHEKEGSGVGEWIYLRDGSSISSLLAKELGILVGQHEEPPQSTDPTE